MNKKTSSRKRQHVRLTVTRDVNFRAKSAGFDRWDFVHNALPELDFTEVDPSVGFLNKKMSLPLLISSMTGGYGDATRINRQLAEVCSESNIGMGVGSQRQALDNTEFYRSYSVVREVAPEIPLIGNIGAAQIAHIKDVSAILRLRDLIQADAFAVHLNPLQEFLQPEGTPNFSGVLQGIGTLVKHLGLPIIVKEIGAGISADVAGRLLDVGVEIIDVAGAGGTSWAGVEILRRNGRQPKGRSHAGSERVDFSPRFWDWGLPTVDALRQVAALKQQHPSLNVIASGGIRNGLDVAKSIAFGADLAGMARPMLLALETGGKKRLLGLIDSIAMELKGALFLTGSRSVKDLQRQHLILNS